MGRKRRHCDPIVKGLIGTHHKCSKTHNARQYKGHLLCKFLGECSKVVIEEGSTYTIYYLIAKDIDDFLESLSSTCNPCDRVENKISTLGTGEKGGKGEKIGTLVTGEGGGEGKGSSD